MEIKLFSNFKTGYSAGTYGCNAEYYTLIITEIKNGEIITNTYNYNGMYTSSNFSYALREKGYIENYIPTIWGKVTRSDLQGRKFYSAYQLKDILKNEHSIDNIVA